MSVGEIGWESLGFRGKRWRSRHGDGCVANVRIASVLIEL